MTIEITFSDRSPAIQQIDRWIDDILRREGGYVHHPHDRGGPTKFGVTMQALSSWLGRNVSEAEIRALDLETARAIYRRDYFERPRFGLLPPLVQPFLFDCAVNHGPRRAVRFLQQVCNELGFGPLIEDGLIGSRTVAASSRAACAVGERLLAALIEARCDFYFDIVAGDPAQQVFLDGWLARAGAFGGQVA